jgi:hypothetical protein
MDGVGGEGVVFQPMSRRTSPTTRPSPPPPRSTDEDEDRSQGLLLQQLWWKGIALWYREAPDYAAALECWQRATTFAAAQQAQRPAQTTTSHNSNDKDDASWADLEQILGAASPPPDNDEHDDQGVSVTTRAAAPLALFVAGCLLDARRYDEARRCLRLCLLACCSTRGKDGTPMAHLQQQQQQQQDTTGVDEDDNDDCDKPSLFHRAIAEYTASYEEEFDKDNPCRYSARIVQLALQSAPGPLLQWKFPYQRPGYYLDHSILPSSPKPFYPSSEHPAWCRILEDNATAIRDEFMELYQQHPSAFSRVGQGVHRDGAGEHDGRVVSKGDWTEVVLFGAGAQAQAHAHGIMPWSRRLLAHHVPDAVSLAHAGGGEVIISVLQPHTKIEAHCASTNLRLTAHLGLVVPPSTDEAPCLIRVAHDSHEWQEGKVLVFDDSYEHAVENSTDSVRVVLLLRFWHWDLSRHGRNTGLHKSLQCKRNDSLCRYNPPLPTPYPEVTDQAMEFCACRNCGQRGYDTIRLVAYDAQVGGTFTCRCGHVLQIHNY